MTSTHITNCPTCSGLVCANCGHTLEQVVGNMICMPCVSEFFQNYTQTIIQRGEIIGYRITEEEDN